jgi:hypothetical protein
MLKSLSVAAILGVTLFAASQVGAQYYDPYGRPPPPRYDRDDDDDERPLQRDWRYERRGPRWDDERGYRPRRFGDACVTSRGTCEARPSPIGSGCGCYFDGFGPKRGIVQ